MNPIEIVLRELSLRIIYLHGRRNDKLIVFRLLIIEGCITSLWGRSNWHGPWLVRGRRRWHHVSSMNIILIIDPSQVLKHFFLEEVNDIW
jgi:hypothetical protein